MNSQKKPINPILDVGFKNFIQRKASKFNMSQSGFLAKLIDAFRLYQEAHSGAEDKDFLEDNKRTAIKGLTSAYAAEYHEGEVEKVLNMEERSKARRFYVTPKQKKWLKNLLGISDTVKVTLAFYMEAKLDKYLPSEIRHREETICSKEFQPLSEEGGD